MKISSLVVLNQDEMREASIAFVKTQMDIADTAVIDVEFYFDPNNQIVASLKINSDGEIGGEGEKKPDTQPTKPRATRTPRKTPTAPQENQGQDPVVEPVAERDDGKSEGEVVDANEDKAEELPWSEDNDAPAVTANSIIAAAQAAAAQQEAAATPAAMITAPKIFENPSSSAAPSTPKPEPVMSAKSLFANLKAPVNQVAN